MENKDRVRAALEEKIRAYEAKKDLKNRIKAYEETHKPSSAINEVYPNKGESKEDFISRFMSATKDEYPDQKQRLAVAYSYWDRRGKALKEEIEEKLPQEEPSKEDRIRGLSSVLHDLIQAQWSIIDQYSSAVATFDFEGFNEYTDSLNELIADETANVGMLEGLLSQLNPAYDEIDSGKEKIEKEFV